LRIADVSINDFIFASKASPISARSWPPVSTGSPTSPSVTMSRSSPIPASPDSGSAPRRTSFAPV
jgi:hypothetical protein